MSRAVAVGDSVPFWDRYFDEHGRYSLAHLKETKITFQDEKQDIVMWVSFFLFWYGPSTVLEKKEKENRERK